MVWARFVQHVAQSGASVSFSDLHSQIFLLEDDREGQRGTGMVDASEAHEVQWPGDFGLNSTIGVVSAGAEWVRVTAHVEGVSGKSVATLFADRRLEVSLFELGLGERACADPFMRGIAGGMSNRWLDALKRSLVGVHDMIDDSSVELLHRPAVFMALDGCPTIGTSNRTRCRASVATLNHIQLILEDVLDSGVSGDVVMVGARPHTIAWVQALLQRDTRERFDTTAKRRRLWVASGASDHTGAYRASVTSVLRRNALDDSFVEFVDRTSLSQHAKKTARTLPMLE